MTNTKVSFERRKVVGNNIIEIYKYDIKETKDEFFKHYKEMQARNFKNNRSEDKVVEGYLEVTYVKDVLAVAPVKASKTKKKGRAQ